MSECDGPQFPPPIAGLYGFGPARCVGTMPANFIDILEPKNFEKFFNCPLAEYQCVY